jgi:NAD dependent epimerase/dehydratase family enzyme
MYGPYNGVAPRPVDNREITSLIARSMKKPLILPSVPGFVLKLLLGEMADLVLQGSKVSSARIQSTGFKFLYPDCKEAVNDLVTNQR